MTISNSQSRRKSKQSCKGIDAHHKETRSVSYTLHKRMIIKLRQSIHNQEEEDQNKVIREFKTIIRRLWCHTKSVQSS